MFKKHAAKQRNKKEGKLTEARVGGFAGIMIAKVRALPEAMPTRKILLEKTKNLLGKRW